MNSLEQAKAAAQSAIDRRRDWLLASADTVMRRPETGFRETFASGFISGKLTELGIPHRNGIALTGIKGYLTGGHPGPTVAVICEMDALGVPGHPDADPETGAAHACGHHCQVGMMRGVAVGLQAPGVLQALSGRVALIAVPAEEFVEVEYRWDLHRQGKVGLMSGKQEFIRLGEFDDVDMAMMVHISASPDDARFATGGTSNGHVVKYVSFIGRAAHAGSAPYHGVNALQAAMVALNALNTQRETLKWEDAVRLHGIVTSGGAAANSVPADVRYEGRVRGRTAEAIADASMKMDRCLRAGALALGANVRIVTLPGYLPVASDATLMDVFGENCVQLVGRKDFVRHPDSHNRGGSTDMGDLSQIMPAIHPYTGGATGTGHGVDFRVTDHEQAVIRPAKAMAMTVIDLLADGAPKARQVVAESPPRMSTEQYLRLQNSRLTEELYEGR